MLCLTTVGNHETSLRNKDIDNIHRLNLRAAPIAAQVEDERLHALPLKVYDGIANQLAAILGESGETNKAHSVGYQAIIRHGRSLDEPARYLEYHVLVR